MADGPEAIRASVRKYGADDYILAEAEKNGLFKESLEKERMIGRKQRETFRAATVSAGEALGRAKDVGTIAVGRYGDLIGVAGDRSRT